MTKQEIYDLMTNNCVTYDPLEWAIYAYNLALDEVLDVASYPPDKDRYPFEESILNLKIKE